jgi:glycosyltransferase involved in cell wall biosynthesis
MKDCGIIHTTYRTALRIVHLTSAHPTTDTRIFIKECRSLVRAGFQVHLIAPGDQNELREQIEIFAIPKTTSRFSRITDVLFQIYKIAKSIDAELYHIHDPDLIFVGLQLQKMGKHVVYDIHEDYPRSLLSRRYIPKIVRKPISLIYEKCEYYAAKRFSAIIAATPAIGKRFQEINSKTVVVNNYPILDELMPVGSIRWDERDISICYVGAITHIRGAIQMIKAMEYLPKNIGAKLEMAGEIWPQELRNQVIELDGWQYVIELGKLNREEVKQLLGRTRVGLVLFHPEPNHVQAQPNKLYEYMSAGIPVIASDFPLWRQIIENTGCGLLANPTDPFSIADAILYLLTNHQEAEVMGKRGREAVVKKYNWKKEEEKLITLDEELTGQKSETISEPLSV